jgi:multidrug efflux system membrane fusion protein
MSDIVLRSPIDIGPSKKISDRRHLRWQLPILSVLLGGGLWVSYSWNHATQAAIPPAAPVPAVTISNPLQRDIDVRIGAVGQFSAIDRVELRAQVGGILSEIHFEDGQIVHKGDLLFVIDPRPYGIRLAQAKAQLGTAKSRLDLANTQLERAQSLRKTGWSTQETYDQRVSEQQAAQAAIDDAQSRIRDAELDLEYTRVTAPFTGRIGARQVSVGGLIAGSRAASSPTTLLATLVSLDPIYLDFDMSEQDYLTFQRERQKQGGRFANKVEASLSDETAFNYQGTLDFLDNAVNRSSGTVHAGEFARVRLGVTPPSPALLVPDASVLADQSTHIVLTVGENNVVVPKTVQLGDLRGGLRVVRSGLAPSDKVITAGIPAARPGSRVSPHAEPIQIASTQKGIE